MSVLFRACRPSLLSWLTMGRKRPRDPELEFPKKRQKDPDEETSHDRRLQLAAALSVEENLIMPACSKCVEHGDVCYYDARQSTKCAKCIEKQRKCDGTFSLEEFRKVGEQKKAITSKVRQKRREIAKLRAALAAIESESVELEDSLAHWEQVSDNMLRREMRAMGVLNEQPVEQEVAFADGVENLWADAPYVEQVDWSSILPDFNSQGVAG